MDKISIKQPVYFWLILGMILIYFQITIGGITRLTGSGLSITKWEVVTGIIPPIGTEAWEDAFALYKETPQYQEINDGMTLSAFKSIYFWEYLHRLWARAMGFVFVIPFFVFWRKGWLSPRMIRRLVAVFIMAGTVGLFGWIMVASGLNDRPWVNAYKLSIHLCLALIVLGYLQWVVLQYRFPRQAPGGRSEAIKYFLVGVTIQILLGGIMSGVKASLVYPDWPDYDGSWLPAVLLEPGVWNVENFVNYDSSPFLAGLAQFCHRTMGYVLIISGLYIWFFRKRLISNDQLVRAPGMLVTMLITQMGLGIMVLYGSMVNVPVLMGVAHQAVAIAILLCTVYIYYFSNRGRRDFN